MTCFKENQVIRSQQEFLEFLEKLKRVFKKSGQWRLPLVRYIY